MLMKDRLLKEIEQGTKAALQKKKIIARHIYKGSATIPDLCREMNLSIPTINKFITEMKEDGYIKECGKLETGSGRQPILYGLNPDSSFFIGVAIKHNSVSIGLTNFNGEIIDNKMNIPYSYVNTPDAITELCNIIKKFINHLEIDKNKIASININLSGRINPMTGYSYSRFNFSEAPLADTLTEMLGYKTSIDNDTRAMAYAEYLKGVVNGEKNIIFVNAGWGVGIGIIINGKIYSGKSGFSGEFGHNCVFDNEIMCHCGKKGCLETEASGEAMKRIIIERVTKGESSILSDTIKKKDKDISIDDIIDAIGKEDPLCIEVIEEVGEKLGKQIAGIINIFNPEMVIIGGSLSETEEYLTLPIKTAVRKYSLNLVNKDTKIVNSKLKDKAGIIGSCLLARSNMFEL